MEIEETDNCAVVKYARTPRGPLHYSNYNKTMHGNVSLICYDCGKALIYRKKHERTRNGIKYDVRECFSHKSSVHTVGCGGGESATHRAAKDAVCKFSAFYYFTTQCLRCAKNFRIDVNASGHAKAISEYKWSNYRLDVGFVDHDDDGKLYGAVEIFYKHAISDDKREALTRENIAWVEVNAIDVLQYIPEILVMVALRMTPSSHDHVVRVVDCAMPQSKCWECKDKGLREDLKLMHSSESYHIVQRTENTIMFGTYWGYKIDDVLKVDPNYVRWLAGYTGYRIGVRPIMASYQDPDFKDGKMHDLARKALHGTCLLCLRSECMRGRQDWQHWCSDCYPKAEIK